MFLVKIERRQAGSRATGERTHMYIHAANKGYVFRTTQRNKNTKKNATFYGAGGGGAGIPRNKIAQLALILRRIETLPHDTPTKTPNKNTSEQSKNHISGDRNTPTKTPNKNTSKQSKNHNSPRTSRSATKHHRTGDTEKRQQDIIVSFQNMYHPTRPIPSVVPRWVRFRTLRFGPSSMSFLCMNFSSQLRV